MIKNKFLNYNNILNILCLLGGLYFLVQVGLNVVAMPSKSPQLLSSNLNYYIKVIQNTVFLLLLYSIFFKYNIKLIPIFAPIAMLEQNINFFHKINYFLLDHGVYAIFSKSPELISPEYPRVIVFLIILCLSLLLLFIKKRRTLARIFLTIGALAIFATSIIFHFAIMWEIDFYKQKSASVIYSNIEYFNSLDYINKFCSTNKYECVVFEKNEINEKMFNLEKTPTYFKPFENMLLPNIMGRPYIKFSATSYLSGVVDRITGQVLIFVTKNPNYTVFISDKHFYKNFLVLNQFIFAYLAFFSHIVWFGGAIFLIGFHNRKIRQKAIKAKSEKLE